MQRKIIFVILIPLLILSQCRADELTVEWIKTYGGEDIDTVEYVDRTVDKGYILVGKTNSFSSGKSDIWLIKTNSNGNEEWNRTFGGVYDEYGVCVHQTKDGGYIIVGSKADDEKSSIWLIKTDSDGNEEWNKTFDSPDIDQAFYVYETSDGYMVFGDRKGNVTDFDIWIIKTDDKGNKEWEKALRGTKYDDKGCFALKVEDGYLIGGHTGYHISNNTTESVAWIIKIDNYGNEEWNKTFGDVGVDNIYSAIYDDGFILVGVKGFNIHGGDLWVIKTDTEGNKEWEKVYGGKDGEVGRSIEKIDDGYIVLGYTYSYGAGKSDVWLVKIDKNGNEEWNLTIGGETFDYGRCIRRTGDGYIIDGYTYSYGAGRFDAWLIKLGEQRKRGLDVFTTLLPLLVISLVLLILVLRTLFR